MTPTVGPGARSWTFKFHFKGDLLCLNVQQMMRIGRAVFQDQAPPMPVLAPLGPRYCCLATDFGKSDESGTETGPSVASPSPAN